MTFIGTAAMGIGGWVNFSNDIHRHSRKGHRWLATTYWPHAPFLDRHPSAQPRRTWVAGYATLSATPAICLTICSERSSDTGKIRRRGENASHSFRLRGDVGRPVPLA